jgi:hypothetical protein
MNIAEHSGAGDRFHADRIDFWSSAYQAIDD